MPCRYNTHRTATPPASATRASPHPCPAAATIIGSGERSAGASDAVQHVPHQLARASGSNGSANAAIGRASDCSVRPCVNVGRQSVAFRPAYRSFERTCKPRGPSSRSAVWISGNTARVGRLPAFPWAERKASFGKNVSSARLPSRLVDCRIRKVPASDESSGRATTIPEDGCLPDDGASSRDTGPCAEFLRPRILYREWPRIEAHDVPANT